MQGLGPARMQSMVSTLPHVYRPSVLKNPAIIRDAMYKQPLFWPNSRKYSLRLQMASRRAFRAANLYNFVSHVHM